MSEDKEAKRIYDAFEAWFRLPTAPADGMFRDHRCWRCQDGDKPCVAGNPRRCEFPHARND